MTSDILIKGMVCERCIAVIKAGITNLGYTVTKTSLGRVSIQEDLAKSDYNRISNLLATDGFELVSSRQMRIVGQAKELIDEVFNDAANHQARVKFSVLLPEKLNMNYNSISELFKETEGVTLEKYIITKRLERVKELLVYTDLTLTEIAFTTGFSSINHLSRQFKDLTGLTPSHFKAIRKERKKRTDDESRREP